MIKCISFLCLLSSISYRVNEIHTFGNPVFGQHFYQWENEIFLWVTWYSNSENIILPKMNHLGMITFKCNFDVTWVYFQGIRVKLCFLLTEKYVQIYRSWYTALQNISLVALINPFILLFSHLCVWVNRIAFNNFPLSNTLISSPWFIPFCFSENSAFLFPTLFSG